MSDAGAISLTSMPPAPQGRHGADVSRLSIARDAVTGDFVYRVIDRATGEVLRQFPAEGVLAAKRALGQLFNMRA